MVYRRRYGYRRNRNYRKKKGTNWGYYARTGFKLATRAMSLLNTETKYHDTFLTAMPIGTTPIIVHMSSLSRGTEETARIGGSIMPKSVLLRMDVNKNVSATMTRCRIMLIQDLDDNNGTAPTAAQIFTQPSATLNLMSPLNKDNAGRFRIIRDIQLRLDANKANSTLDIYHTFGMYKNQQGLRVKAPHITWDASEGSERGHLYLVHMSSEATNTPTYNLYRRLNFIDN